MSCNDVLCSPLAITHASDLVDLSCILRRLSPPQSLSKHGSTRTRSPEVRTLSSTVLHSSDIPLKMSVGQEQPFELHVPDADLQLLNDKLAFTRFPDELDGAGLDDRRRRVRVADLLGAYCVGACAIDPCAVNEPPLVFRLRLFPT